MQAPVASLCGAPEQHIVSEAVSCRAPSPHCMVPLIGALPVRLCHAGNHGWSMWPLERMQLSLGTCWMQGVKLQMQVHLAATKGCESGPPAACGHP